MSFSHLDQQGKASMVDITDKPASYREAWAKVSVKMSPACFTQLMDKRIAKGDVFAVARVAAIQAAKKTAELIPLCHPLALSKIEVDFDCHADKSEIEIFTCCKLSGKTGVEMEALTAASVAALTLFDMCKAVDPLMVIDGLQVTEKRGGKSGDWQR